MQAWSDDVVHERFRVRFFLDTNLLIYLVDKTYPSFNDFIELLNEPYRPFVELVSSKYVIFEFVGVRKKEHYQRLVIKHLAAKPPEGLGILKDCVQTFRDNDKYYLSDEIFDEVKFDNLIPHVKTEVEAEVERIATEFGINYEYGSLHKDQLSPTKEVCLTSKVSNYDSMILVSAVLPWAGEPQSNVIFLTADTNLVTFCDPVKLSSALSTHTIPPPNVHSIKNIQVTKGISINLSKANEKAELQETVKETLLTLIKKQLPEYYLGTTVEPKSHTIPKDIIFIQLVKDFPLVDKIEALNNPALGRKMFLTIISKDLDFIYMTKQGIESFWYQNKQINAGDVLPANKNDVIVSFTVRDVNDEKKEIPVDPFILDSIRANDNLVFIHPDSSV